MGEKDTIKESRFDLRDSEIQQEKWIEDSPIRVGLRASNTVETLKPNEVNTIWKKNFRESELPSSQVDQTFKNQYLGNWGTPVQKTDNLPEANIQNTSPKYNILPVDWPTAQDTMGLPKDPVLRSVPANTIPQKWAPENKTPKTVLLPSLYERVTKLEEQIDGLLDRIARFNFKASHKL